MDILSLTFEEPLYLLVAGQTVQVIAFKTTEQGNIKFGIKAPRSLDVHREEVYQAIKHQQDQNNIHD